MKFSDNEKKDLFFAGIMLSVAFAILLSDVNSLFSLSPVFLISFLVAFFTAGIGFLLHELMHKIVAVSYGLSAEFKASYGWLWMAILFSLAGFILAAPGAVWISGRGLTKERNGKISLAGPLTNIGLALLFILIYFVSSGFVKGVAQYGWIINALLGAFNMIPVMPFDGYKIMAWNKVIWGITTLTAVVLFGWTFFL